MILVTINPTQLALVLAGLLCFGVLYNEIVVDNLAAHLPQKYRATSWEVVVGVLVTLIGIGALLGLETMLVCLLCFAASGIPMILGDYRRLDRLPE